MIIGIGAYGRMTIPEPPKDELIKKKIKLIEEPTQKTCGVFNTIIKKGVKAVGGFHITC